MLKGVKGKSQSKRKSGSYQWCLEEASKAKEILFDEITAVCEAEVYSCPIEDNKHDGKHAQG